MPRKILGLALVAWLAAVSLATALSAAPDPTSRAGPQAVGGRAFDPRHLVEELYTAPGQLPIRDMIVELECSDLAGGGSEALVPSSTDRVYYKYPNRLRVESVIHEPGGPLDGKQAVIIHDGANSWMFVSMGQYPVKKEQGPIVAADLPFGLMHYAQDADRQYSLEGVETYDDVQVQVVKIVSPATPGAYRKLWIDTVRRVPLLVEVGTPGEKADQGPQVRKVAYKDIRKLSDGRYVPFRLETYDGGKLVKVRIYQGVKVNVGLQDSLFEPMDKFVK